MSFMDNVKKLKEFGLYEDVLNGGQLQYKARNGTWIDTDPGATVVVRPTTELRIKPVPKVEDFRPLTAAELLERYGNQYLEDAEISTTLLLLTGVTAKGGFLNGVHYTFEEILIRMRAGEGKFLGVPKSQDSPRSHAPMPASTKITPINGRIVEDEDEDEEEEDDDY